MNSHTFYPSKRRDNSMELISVRLSQFPDFHVISPSWRMRSSQIPVIAVFRHGFLRGVDALTHSSHLSEGPLLGPDLGPGKAPLLPALVSLLHGLPWQVSLAFLSHFAVLNTHLCCAATACPWCAPQAAADPHAKEDTEEPARSENIRSSWKTRLCELGLRHACRLVPRARVLVDLP